MHTRHEVQFFFLICIENSQSISCWLQKQSLHKFILTSHVLQTFWSWLSLSQLLEMRMGHQVTSRWWPHTEESMIPIIYRCEETW